MKLLKFITLSLLFAVASCNTDQIVNDGIGKKNVSSQKINNEYSLDQILNGLREWETMRTTDRDVLLSKLSNVNSFDIDISLFPQGPELNAYACILDEALKFVVISEVYDNATYHDNINDYIYVFDLTHTTISMLTESSYENYSFPFPTQYIQATDALKRIEDWNLNYVSWVLNTSTIYQGFNIPTYDLQQQIYKVYLGLTSNDNSDIQSADLILDNTNGMFYDTVHMFPPKRNYQNHYVLELL